MALTRTAGGTAAGKTATITVANVPVDVAIGDLVVALVASDAGITSAGYGGGSFGAAKVTATNTGNVVTRIYADNAASAFSSGAWSVDIVPATSGDACAVAVLVIKGNATVSPLDASSTGTGTGTSPSSGATGTLAQADEICIGAIGIEGIIGDAAGTWSNSFNAGQRVATSGGGATSNVMIDEGYLIVSGTAAQTAAKTGIGSRDWAAAIATFKAAAVNAIPNKIYEFNQAVKRSNFY